MNTDTALEYLRLEIEQLTRENRQLKQRPVRADNRKKLTGREVTEIRRLTRTTGMTQREIAGIYDINPATVSRIVRGIYHSS